MLGGQGGFSVTEVAVDTGFGEMMLMTIMAERGGPAAYGQKQVPGVYRMGIEGRESAGVTVYIHGGFWGRLAYKIALILRGSLYCWAH